MRIKHHALLALALALPLGALADYDVNYDAGTVTSGSRSLNGVTLTSTADGAQTIDVSQSANSYKLYLDRTGLCFSAMPGETVTVNFDFEGSWMHGYVYLDCGKDGKFDVATDLLSYSYLDGKNSTGAELSSMNPGVVPPPFTIPADLKPGLYRMRFKIDWNSDDPGGNCATSTGSHQQLITTNGGAIADAMLYVHGEGASALNTEVVGKGSLTAADGSTLTLPAAGSDLVVKTVPAEGQRLDALYIIAGYDCGDPNVTFANPALTGIESRFAPTINNLITVPAANLKGNVTVKGVFVDASTPVPLAGNYESDYSGTKSVADGITEINGIAVNSTTLHTFMDTPAVAWLKGTELSINAKYNGLAKELRLFIDLNSDGGFFNGVLEEMTLDANELMATAGKDGQFAPVTTTLAPGVYRARIEAKGHCTVDFLLNIHEANGVLDVKALNGMVNATSNYGALPNTIAFNTGRSIYPVASLPGYTAESVIVRHGHNLNGPAFDAKGNRQWRDEVYPYAKSIKIPNEVVDGDVDIYVLFKEDSSSEWTKVWGDEFNGNSIDPSRWGYQERYSAAWNRFCAEGNEVGEVNIVSNGRYNSYCMPTPKDKFPNESKEMISGAIKSAGKFHFTYGRVEARIRTTRHTGNFPAFWLMPQVQSKGWPKDGEIDIWEQINTDQRAHHTIHSAWTYQSYGSISQSSPTSTGNEAVDHDLWHVYALEWEADELRWYVDGKKVFTYTNQHFSEEPLYTEQDTWPFYKDFYVILNQSVGNGSWAANRDETFTYLTEFDWVRVYQKKDAISHTNILGHNGDDEFFYVPDESGIEEITIDGPVRTGDDSVLYDLQGRRAPAHPAPGLYVTGAGSKILVK